MSNWDEEISGRLRDDDSGFSELGHWVGRPALSAAAIGTMLVATPFTENAKYRSFTFTVAQAFIVDTVVAFGVKSAVGRERPNGADDQSFYSGHTSNTFMWATVIEDHFGWKAGVPAYVVASLVGVSRVTRGSHWASDVIFGAAMAVYDFGRMPDNFFYYAMEYLHGIDLQDLVDQTGPQPAGRVIHALQQACGSLSEAHAIGVIHRDIKPANIMLCDRGGVQDFAKVLDFGIVKVIDGNVTQLTQTGMLSGTPLYIPPEALRGSGREDWWALHSDLAGFSTTGADTVTTSRVMETIAAQPAAAD